MSASGKPAAHAVKPPERNAAKPSQGKRERAKADNRRAILAAARIVFVELGYEAASVRDIIRRTDLASGTFYNYFKSKEEVFQALVAHTEERVRPVLSEGRREAETTADYVRACYRAFFDLMVEDYQPVLEALGEDVAIPPLAGYSHVSRVIFEDVREQLLNLDFPDAPKFEDPELLAASLIAVAEAVAHEMLNRRPLDPVSATRFASSFALAGMVGVTAAPS